MQHFDWNLQVRSDANNISTQQCQKANSIIECHVFGTEEEAEDELTSVMNSKSVFEWRFNAADLNAPALLIGTIEIYDLLADRCNHRLNRGFISYIEARRSCLFSGWAKCFSTFYVGSAE